MRHLWRKACVVVATAAAATAVAGLAAPAGSAGLLCGGSAGRQVFLPWLDAFSYYAAPGGSFEAGAAPWSLGAGAAVVSGNEPFYLSSPSDSRSLSLSADAAATSPGYCLSATQLDVRMVARGGGAVRVDVLGSGLLGTTLLSTAWFTPGSSWAPSPILVFGSGLNLSTQTVQLRLTAVGGPVQVDDVYVDPLYCT